MSASSNCRLARCGMGGLPAVASGEGWVLPMPNGLKQSFGAECSRHHPASRPSKICNVISYNTDVARSAVGNAIRYNDRGEKPGGWRGTSNEPADFQTPLSIGRCAPTDYRRNIALGKLPIVPLFRPLWYGRLPKWPTGIDCKSIGLRPSMVRIHHLPPVFAGGENCWSEAAPRWPTSPRRRR